MTRDLYLHEWRCKACTSGPDAPKQTVTAPANLTPWGVTTPLALAQQMAKVAREDPSVGYVVVKITKGPNGFNVYKVLNTTLPAETVLWAAHEIVMHNDRKQDGT